MSTKADTAPTTADAKPTKADGSQLTGTTTPLPGKKTADVANPTETEWKITIKGSDGTTNEIILSRMSAKNPVRQEINIYMPGAKDSGDVEKAKVDKVSNI
jgi:hypothetical protein